MIDFLKNFFSGDKKDAAHACGSHKHEHDVMNVGGCASHEKPAGGCGSHAAQEEKKEEKPSGCCGGGCH